MTRRILHRAHGASRVSENNMSSIYSTDAPIERDRWVPNRAGHFLAALGYPEDEITPTESTEFAETFEQEFARTLDQRGIAWMYKPRTFAVEWDEDGNFIDSFTPSFFLPASDLYLEVVGPNCRSLGEQSRKAGLLRQQYPGTSIEVFNVAGSGQHFDRAC